MVQKLLALRAATTEAPRFVDTLGLDFLLPFELDGRQHPVPDVFAFRVVEHFDVVEYVLASFIATTVNPATWWLPRRLIE